MSSKPSVLVIGLGPDSLPVVSPKPGVIPSRSELIASLDKAKATLQACNIHIELLYAGAGVGEFSVDAEAAAADVRAKLAEREWSAVQIGFGVRGNPAFTDLFEKLVQCVAEETFGKGKRVAYSFPENPDGIVPGLKRIGIEVQE